MTDQTPLRIFSVDGCAPCEQVKEALEADNYEVLGLEGDIAIETLDVEQNFGAFEEVGADYAIPSAYHGMQQCKIFIDEDTKKVTFDCRSEEEKEPEIAEVPGEAEEEEVDAQATGGYVPSYGGLP